MTSESERQSIHEGIARLWFAIRSLTDGDYEPVVADVARKVEQA